MRIKNRLEALERRAGKDRTIFVRHMFNEAGETLSPAQRERKLAAVRGEAGPDDIIFVVEVEHVEN